MRKDDDGDDDDDYGNDDCLTHNNRINRGQRGPRAPRGQTAAAAAAVLAHSKFDVILVAKPPFPAPAGRFTRVGRQ